MVMISLAHHSEISSIPATTKIIDSFIHLKHVVRIKSLPRCIRMQKSCFAIAASN